MKVVQNTCGMFTTQHKQTTTKSINHCRIVHELPKQI